MSANNLDTDTEPEIPKKRIKLSENDDNTKGAKILTQILQREISAEIKRRKDDLTIIEDNIFFTKQCLLRLRHGIVSGHYKQKREKDYLHDLPHPAVRDTFHGKTPRNYFETENPNGDFETQDRIKMILQIKEELEKTTLKQDNCGFTSTELQNDSNDTVLVKAPCYVPPNPLKVDAVQPPEPRGYFSKKHFSIIVGNVSKWLAPEEHNRATHKWTVYTKTSDSSIDISMFVSKVVFFLHPSYKPNDVVPVMCPPFKLTRRGWGEFPLRTRFYFKNPLDVPVDLMHVLKLDDKHTGYETFGAETALSVWIHLASQEQNHKYETIPNDNNIKPIIEPLKYSNGNNNNLNGNENNEFFIPLKSSGIVEFNKKKDVSKDNFDNDGVISNYDTLIEVDSNHSLLLDNNQIYQNTNNSNICVNQNTISTKDQSTDKFSFNKSTDTVQNISANKIEINYGHSDFKSPYAVNEIGFDNSINLDDYLDECNIVESEVVIDSGNDPVSKVENVNLDRDLIGTELAPSSHEKSDKLTDLINGSINEGSDDYLSLLESAAEFHSDETFTDEDFNLFSNLINSHNQLDQLPTLENNTLGHLEVDSNEFKTKSNNISNSLCKKINNTGLADDTCNLYTDSKDIVGINKVVMDYTNVPILNKSPCKNNLIKCDTNTNIEVSLDKNENSFKKVAVGSLLQSPGFFTPSNKSNFEDIQITNDNDFIIDFTKLPIINVTPKEVNFKGETNVNPINANNNNSVISCNNSNFNSISTLHLEDKNDKLNEVVIKPPRIHSINVAPSENNFMDTKFKEISSLNRITLSAATSLNKTSSNGQINKELRNEQTQNNLSLLNEKGLFKGNVISLLKNKSKPINILYSKSFPKNIVLKKFNVNASTSIPMTKPNSVLPMNKLLNDTSKSHLSSEPSIIKIDLKKEMVNHYKKIASPLNEVRVANDLVIDCSANNKHMSGLVDGASLIHQPTAQKNISLLDEISGEDTNDVKSGIIMLENENGEVIIKKKTKFKEFKNSRFGQPQQQRLVCNTIPENARTKKTNCDIFSANNKPATNFVTSSPICSKPSTAKLPLVQNIASTSLNQNKKVVVLSPKVVRISNKALSPMTPLPNRLDKSTSTNENDGYTESALLKRCPTQSTETAVSWLVARFPLVDARAQLSGFHSRHPYCAKSRDDFLGWPVPKQRAAEWMRAKKITRLLDKLPSIQKWSTMQVLDWSRIRAFTPLKNDFDCNSPNLYQDIRFVYSQPTDSILSYINKCKYLKEKEEIDVSTTESVTSPLGESFYRKKCFKYKLPPEKEEVPFEPELTGMKTFINNCQMNVGATTCSEVISPGILYPAADRMLISIFNSIAEDIIRRSYNASYIRHCDTAPVEIIEDDVKNAILSRKEFDFLVPAKIEKRERAHVTVLQNFI